MTLGKKSEMRISQADPSLESTSGNHVIPQQGNVSQTIFN
jgi:hypothetical protein